MAGDATPKATITSQYETFAVTGRGTAEQVIRVWFRTAKGVDGSVDVPKKEYTQDRVFAAVGEAAARLDSVHQAQVPQG
jgi:hypothetical protein